jgi:hypothetical protein
VQSRGFLYSFYDLMMLTAGIIFMGGLNNITQYGKKAV